MRHRQAVKGTFNSTLCNRVAIYNKTKNEMSKHGNYKDGYEEIDEVGKRQFQQLINDTAISERKVIGLDRYNPCDMIVSSETKYIGAEIKVRERDFEDGLLIEKHKWATSPKSAKESGATEWLYVNFINNDVCYIYTEEQIQFGIDEGIVTEKVLETKKDTTFADNGKVWQKPYLLPQSLAYKFKNINGKWTYIR